MARAHLEDGNLLQYGEIHVQGQLGLQLVWEQAQRRVDVSTPLYPPPRPAIIVPPENPPLHAAWHLVMSHVRLGAI